MILIKYYTNKDDKDDPLSYYQEKVTKLLHENQINEVRKLLKFILVKYKHDPRYQNSPQYLKLWLILIFYLDKHHCQPFVLPILFGLIENQIGDKLTILYETIALELIKQNHLDQVEPTLLLGLKRKAQPIKRLRSTLLHFKLNTSIQFNLSQVLFPNDDHLPQLNNNNAPDLVNGHELLHWIHIKLHHFVRKDILEECLLHSYSIEEYRSLYHRPRKQVILYKVEQDNDNSHTVAEEEAVLSASIPNLKSNVIQLPLTPGFIQSIFSSHDFQHYFSDLEKAAEPIIKKIKSLKNKKGANLFELRNIPYHIVKKLGEGGFASVYLVQDLSLHQCFYGLKIQQPAHPWEFFILGQLQSLDFILPVYAFQHYADASFLFMRHLPYGTLLDFFNRYRQQCKSASLPESILLIMTWKLLSQLLVMHKSHHISHNDLKLDNIMIYPPSAKQHQDLDQVVPKLIFIDFGQSIYTPALPLGERTLCKAAWINDANTDYPLFQSSFLPFQADYWQLAVMIHLLLFGVPMTYTSNQGTYKIKQAIKRYWHKQLWTRFFHVMLNAHQLTDQDVQDVATELHNASLALFQENSLILHPIYSIIESF